MKIVAHIVARNEADRYLPAVIAQLRLFGVNEVAVFDDQSTDDTVNVALKAGAIVRVRGDDEPSFADNEALFRQAGWEWMLERTCPDMVLAIDADELLVVTDGPVPSLRSALYDAATVAARWGAAVVKIIEVWGIQDGVPMERVDGWWGTIRGVRLASASLDPMFAGQAMGGGSVPTANMQAAPLGVVSAVAIAHLGYLRTADRYAKHNRYHGVRGHNPQHVASILTNPTLTSRPLLAPWPEGLR